MDAVSEGLQVATKDQCDYCLRNQFGHGGQCHKGPIFDRGCLGFELDPRGKWEWAEASMTIELGDPIPREGETREVNWRGVHKTIRITKVRQCLWARDNKKGLIGLTFYVEFGYWSHENGYATKKPKLTLV